MQYIKHNTRAEEANAALEAGMQDWLEIATARRRRAEAAIAERGTRRWFNNRREAEGIAPNDGWDVYLEARQALQDMDMARARRRAREEGIDRGLFWLLKGLQIDVQAVHAAIRQMADMHGPRCRTSKGGWDSAGHYGLGQRDVEKAWYAAGCSNTRKYRFILRAVSYAKEIKPSMLPQFRKGDSLQFCINYAKGWCWLVRNCLVVGSETPAISRKAIAALGRMSAALRWAAVEGVEVRAISVRQVPVRIRDLNWERVALVQAALRGNPTAKVRAACLPVRGALELLTGELPKPALTTAGKRQLAEEAGSLLLPQYRQGRLTWGESTQVVLGVAPSSLARFQGLTTKECHQYLTDNHEQPDVQSWFAGVNGVPVHRSVVVMRWLVEVRRRGWWENMTRERVQRVGGQEHRFNFLQLIDEVQEEDIQSGKDGVAAVFQRVSERHGEEFYLKSIEDHRTLRHDYPEWTKHLPRGMRLLNTPSELAAEGRDMKHCAGTYIEAVRRKETIVLSVVTRHGRSTVEISDLLILRQHRTVKNDTPCRRNDALVRAWLNRERRSLIWRVTPS